MRTTRLMTLVRSERKPGPPSRKRSIIYITSQPDTKSIKIQNILFEVSAHWLYLTQSHTLAGVHVTP